MTLGILPTQHGIGERSMPERSQILVGKSGCWRLAVVLVTAVLYSATAPTAQTQPIRTFPASVVFQKDSFDCGPAALATLLQLRLRRPATLPELTQTVPELSWQEWRRIHTHGYSLGQLVAMTVAVGARPTLRRLTARGLAKISLPVLVYLDLPSGPHYSVLTGMVGSQVALADPSLGAVVWPKEQFLLAWSTTGTGYALSVTAGPVG
jgi:predicted double-glycine peptidase